MFAVEFTVGEKRGLESKTNKCVLYCRRSEKFPMVGIQQGMPWGVSLGWPPALGASSKEPQC